MEKSSYLGEVYEVFRLYFEEGKREEVADLNWRVFGNYPEFFKLLDVCVAIEKLDVAIAEAITATPRGRRQDMLRYLQQVVRDLVSQCPVAMTVIDVCEKTFSDKVAQEEGPS